MLKFYLKIPRFLKIVLLVFVVIFIAFIFLNKKSPAPTPLPSPLPKEGFGNYLNQPNKSDSDLQLTNIDPQPPTFESFWSTQKIIFAFNYEIDPETIRYQVTPKIQTKLFFDPQKPKEFYLVPLTGWEENQKYTFTIKSGLQATTKQGLNQDIVISLIRTVPSQVVPDTGI